MQGTPELITGLKAIDRTKPYGTVLCDALWALCVSPAIEAVCLRLISQTKSVEVYLTQRSPDDTAYPGEWHCPGSLMRPMEEFDDTMIRLGKREFGGKILSAQFVANVNHPTEARGHFLSLVYLCTLDEKAEGLKGEWFPVDQLPEKTVECHRYRIIPAAVGAFAAQNTQICW